MLIRGLSERLQQAMLDYNNGKGITELELSQISKVPRASIYNILRNDNNPQAKTLIKFCDALHVSADWLLGLKEEKAIHPYTGETLIYPGLRTMWETPISCPNCCEHLSLDWSFCPECGRPIENPPPV